jgi:hypothetical protein
VRAWLRHERLLANFTSGIKGAWITDDA